jgi:hypothetical protein
MLRGPTCEHVKMTLPTYLSDEHERESQVYPAHHSDRRTSYGPVDPDQSAQDRSLSASPIYDILNVIVIHNLGLYSGYLLWRH